MAPDVAIASVSNPSDRLSGLAGERNWQRHGVESASAALNGALVVGAAHITNEVINSLPSLAACHRGGIAQTPVTTLSFESSVGLSAMVRIFDNRPKPPLAEVNPDADWPQP
jgi:hypothetical protein